jgi:ParB-like chromosome segregation protein Spo0J
VLSRHLRSSIVTDDSMNLAWIAEPIRHLAVPVAELVFDPANARQHGEANLLAITGALRQFGQRVPIVVQREGMIVRAGNGRLQAAIDLGWTHIAAVIIDEDNASAISFAIADNRTAELAEWDDAVLARLLHAVELGDADLQQMLGDLAGDRDLFATDEAAEPADDESDRLRAAFAVLVTCADEAQQVALLDEFMQRGLTCRSLVS